MLGVNSCCRLATTISAGEEAAQECRALVWESHNAVLSQDLPQRRAKGLNILALKRSQLPQDQPLLDRSQDGFDQRRLR